LKRTEELKNQKAMELTAEHAKSEKEEKRRQKELHTSAEKKSRKRKDVTMEERPKTKTIKEAADPNLGAMRNAGNPTPRKKKKKDVTTMKGQGNRKLPTPCDSYGCKHVGVLELKELPKTYLKTYVKEGGWLFQLPCYDCKKKSDKEVGGNDESDRILDLANLLTGRKRNVDDMARYCNFGVTSHGMEEDNEWKKSFACDMVLCIPCYKERLVESGHGASGREQRSRRGRK
jgi:hypothetical protein